MATSTRRPRRLPARVYWVRRCMVLGTALLLVFAVARLVVGGGTDTPAPTADDTAAPAAAQQTPTANAGPLGPMPLSAGRSSSNPSATATGTAPPVGLPDPDGPCDADEISVTPAAGTPDAGGPVPLLLQLTGVRPACTFQVSPSTVVAKVTAGGKRIWSSQDCPSSVQPASVVVRSGTPTTVQVTWSGRRSDAHCTRAAAWALPGKYQVIAAVVGSEPGQADFSLGTPPRPVVTKTITPKPKKVVKKKKQTPSVGRRSG